MTEQKKKRPLWQWALVAILVFGFIGFAIGTEEGDLSDSTSKPAVVYEWELIQSMEFDTEGTLIGLIFEEVYDDFTLPEDAVEWKAEVTWKGGDKDSYIKITFWRYGEDDDVNIGHIYENSKQGTETFNYDKIEKGRTYFVEASAINDLYGTIEVYVKVPQ